MIKVEAIYPLTHDGDRKRGDVFEVSERHAELLTRRGLVRTPGEKPKAEPKQQKAEAKKVDKQ